MRTLIFGASGLIGRHLFDAWQAHGATCWGTAYRHGGPGLIRVDLRDETRVREIVSDYEPELVIHAMRRVGHSGAMAHLARAVDAINARLVIFTGPEMFTAGGSAITESAPPSPVTLTGCLMGEDEAAIRDALPQSHLVIRTADVFGTDAQGIASVRWLRDLSSGVPAEFSRTRQLQPTYAADLANAAWSLCEGGQTGTVHVVGPERISEYTFARLAAFVHGYDCDMVRGVDDYEAGFAALDRGAGRRLLGTLSPRRAADGLRAMRDVQPPLRVAAAA